MLVPELVLHGQTTTLGTITSGAVRTARTCLLRAHLTQFHPFIMLPTRARAR